MALGYAIACYREKQNIKQKDLANDLNISKAQLCLIESNARKPGLKLLQKIADRLKVSVWQILLESLKETDELAAMNMAALEKAEPLFEKMFGLLLAHKEL